MPQIPDALEVNGYPFLGRPHHMQTGHNSTPIALPSAKSLETATRAFDRIGEIPGLMSKTKRARLDACIHQCFHS